MSTIEKVQMYAPIEGMVPSPYQLGHKYLTVGGDIVKLTGVSNFNNSYQTMYMNDELITMENGTCTTGCIHRYTARDFGRCTGTDYKNPDPRNLRYPPVEVL